MQGTVFITFIEGVSYPFASISHSPKGWTDQELGEMWIIKDFEPTSAARNEAGGYRLLILDGHNSHCTYGFCKFAAKHNIIIICLPSHTTHALQPCDVACFGPLASAWKSEVNAASADYMEITKRNLLVFYSKARDRALKKSTIISAFAKTGIWPFNRHALDSSVFEPSKNTTTEPAQPMPAKLPTLLVPIHVLHDNGEASATDNEVRYTIPLPPAIRHTATRVELHHENQQLRHTIRFAEVQLEKDFMQMKLMDSENGRLRKQVHAKEKRRAEKKGTTQAHARLMTGTENLDALAEKDFMKIWKDVMKELGPRLKQIRKEISDHSKAAAEANRRAAAAARKATQGRAHCGQQRQGGRSRGQGQGRGRGRGRGQGRGRGGMSGSDPEKESEDDSEGSSNACLESSGSEEAGQTGDGCRDKLADVPLFPTQPTEQVVQPRPRPRPTYRATAPAIQDAGSMEVPCGHTRGVPIDSGTANAPEIAEEGQNVADNERRYPRRSNRTNHQFRLGIDA
jgi:hypothetical protein